MKTAFTNLTYAAAARGSPGIRTQSDEQASRLRSRGSTPCNRWIWGGSISVVDTV